MIKTLVKHGNSFALIIDKPILDLLNIKEDTPLEITTDGTGLRLVPAAANPRKLRVAAAYADFKGRYAEALKRLAE